ncbi:CmcJ/NvfI family oxidoreductase [Reyranella sp. CPCC 100927]|uniref:CmcJ/NvfI family oxidoreductase n=1 Tax=Reyranella sp. CPCC 100927 TaxID=2599616 RepID=UPI0011B54D3E|nr:CmcJ/NvfI family oxidoreductase [Reyranella sp. CPCC 100927]TWT09462.1 methyltransferase [Reyranella sp. CPCC 100927]
MPLDETSLLDPGVVATLPHVDADVHYLAPIAERPRNYTFDPPGGAPRSNTEPDTHRVAIHDLRPIADSISLDSNGFALVQHQSAVSDFYDDAEVRRVYYPEVERVIKEATGADRVYVFDHVVRRHVPKAEDRAVDAPRQPAWRVHIDHTVRSGPQRARDLLPDDADELLRGRVQVINLWRPIRGPLQDAPLAVCDATSINAEDLVPSDLVYPSRVGETYSVKYNPSHRWFYVPRMQPSEALLLKCTDSSTSVAARHTPHTAFVDPTTAPDAPPRESIEVRTLVFHSA